MLVAALLLQAAAPDAPCSAERVGRERVYSGIFLDEFEAERFFEGKTSMAGIDRRSRPYVSLDFDVVGKGSRFGIHRREPYQAYQIRFRGVERTRNGYPMKCGYGHEGVGTSEMTLTELLAIKPVSAP